MRGLEIAALAAIVTFSGCVQSQPEPPVAEPASDSPAAALEQPEPSATAAAPIAEPISNMPPIAVVDPTAPAAMASPVAEPISDAPPIAVVDPTISATPPSPAAPATASRPAAAAPTLAQATSSAAASSEPPAAGSPENATASAPAESMPPATPPATPPVAVTAPAQPPNAQEQLDLAALEQRLRETRAIGVFTKLSIKNQVDDLLNQFRSFYQGRLRVQLEELRERYELLLFKVLTLLQDADRELAEAITASREAIWGILTDPQQLEKI